MGNVNEQSSSSTVEDHHVDDEVALTHDTDCACNVAVRLLCGAMSLLVFVVAKMQYLTTTPLP